MAADYPVNESALAEQIIARHESMKSDQSNWRQLWDDCSKYVMPRKGDIVTKNTPGQEQTTQIYDTTAEESVQIFAAGLLAQLTPPGESWFKFEPTDPEASEPFRSWLSECTDRAIKAIYASNFYLAWHEDCLDAGTFGTSCLYLEDGKRNILNFMNVPVGTFAICEDNEGMVDTIYREWKWCARQAEQQWGRDALGKQVREALDSKVAAKCDRQFTFVHAVYPRRDGEWREGIVEPKLRRIASCYVCLEDRHVLSEGGYYEMPYFAGRLERSNNEVYGRGPGVQALPEIRVLNRMELDIMLALELMVKPGWLMPDDNSYTPNNKPDGITYWDATNPNAKPEQLQRTNRIDLGEQKTEQKRQRIRSAFFVDMFQALSNPAAMQRQKTAFEVAQIVQERLVLFSPLFARIVQEKLNPMLERVFSILLRAGRLPEPPEDAANGGYEIAYTSKIALAIKGAQNNALLETIQLVGMMQPLDPGIPHIIKWGESLRAFLRNRGLPEEWLRPQDEIDEIVAQQAQQAQAMQAAQTAEMAAGAAQKLGPAAMKAVTEQLGI